MAYMPPPAGIVYSRSDGGVASCVTEERRPATPEAIRKWRHSRTSIRDLQKNNPNISFGNGGVKASDHVADIWGQPGGDTDVNRLKLALAETVYRTSKREPLGKGYQRGHQLPGKVKGDTFKFGVSSDKSEAAKALLYPSPSEADMSEEDRRLGPGEQRRRGYNWNIDIEQHRFGRPGSLEPALCLDNRCKPPSRLVSKKLDDFRETQDAMGRAKNLGNDSRDHLGEHIYGKEAVKRGLNEWDARACVEGDYSWAEQQPDNDLGKSITPGFRNAVAERRAFGVPTIRTDIEPYTKRSVADIQNFGDDPNARFLVNPSQFSQFGIEDDEFFVKRGKRDLRLLFEAIGFSVSPEAFESMWRSAVGREHPGSRDDKEKCSIVSLQDAINDYLEAGDGTSSGRA